jgi:molybdenum cofactor cytidylyltransferase
MTETSGDRASGNRGWTMTVTGLVLAAGGSRRLGRPKQLLAYRGSTLLDATLHRIRSFGLDQVIVALGGASQEVRARVDLGRCDVVDNVRYTSGCSSSIVAALDHVEGSADGLLLFLGDQPDVSGHAVASLLAVVGESGAPVGVCRYRDGRGHPFWFARSVFTELQQLHGDKAVWKLLESGRWPVAEAEVDEVVPIDVDTWDDYQRLLAQQPA